MSAAEMIRELRKLLQQRNGTVQLTVEDDGYVQQDDWVYLIVTPVNPDVRAYEYVERLSELERDLRQETGEDKVMLVPAAPD